MLIIEHHLDHFTLGVVYYKRPLADKILIVLQLPDTFYTSCFTGASNYCQSEQISTQDNARKLAAQLQSVTNDEHELLEVLNMIYKYGVQSQPWILAYFVQDISNLISHESKSVRNQAYELFLRLLRYDKKRGDQATKTT